MYWVATVWLNSCVNKQVKKCTYKESSECLYWLDATGSYSIDRAINNTIKTADLLS